MPSSPTSAGATPARYGADWARATRRYRVLTELLVGARQRPVLAPHIVPVAARLPRLFAAAVNALG
ncbi:hypothetical protein ROS62_13360 [Streptomyces sp. DSM 41972]|uniref:Uncharacterized protein n=1 Tax=Streptomyces althioticus subsp. attaecolombicae TaxID=3075534 RepID=A0ABU3HYR4_9ACTN|nr:hypothetical protein [Streptomyces sp. DSM 41972]SCD58811.1 hypothetical protein GA0115245_109722 [Streptomyces sp. di188]SCD59267.1 hypothetical protein GA0115238_116722 [Streptomyces sp. di50b]